MGSKIAPPRFILFALLFAIAGGGAGTRFTPGIATMAGFDIAAAVFLLSLWPVLRSSPADIRAHAAANDANRALLLGLTAVVSLVLLVAVGVELSGDPTPEEIALVIATLALAWLFSNTVYALHYAHLFYGNDLPGKGDDGGLDFPATKEPDYSDFLYFSYTLGMTFQTSDVAMTDRRLRRVATGQCLAAFVFNLGILAFTINVLGG